MATDRKMASRLLKDRLFKHLMTFGGLSVIIAISVIFFFLLSVVFPVFTPASIKDPNTFQTTALSGPKLLDVMTDEGRETVSMVYSDGTILFKDFKSGQMLSQTRLELPSGVQVTSFGRGERSSRISALGLANGQVLVFKTEFKVSFPNDVKTITPVIEYPFGSQPFNAINEPIDQLSLQVGASDTGLVLVGASGRLTFVKLEVQENLITGEASVTPAPLPLAAPGGPIQKVFLSTRRDDIYVVHSGRMLAHYRIRDLTSSTQPVEHALWPEGELTSAVTLLSAGQSLIVASNKGNINQWFNVRDPSAASGVVLSKIRDFDGMPGAITAMTEEHYRKGFAVGDAKGNLGLYYATSARQLEVRQVSSEPIVAIDINSRANGVVTVDAAGGIRSMVVSNEYPEVSFATLWLPVHYESYDQPEYIWQSTAESNDFEPKLSLAPLTFGTLKAAFYAMLLSIPLAIGAAICSAYFMAPKMRQIVKPSVEIMEALPTVILGFLAGLWLAPLVELNLMATLLLFVVIPVSFVVAAWVWEYVPESITAKVPPGWETLLLVPVCIFAIWFSFLIGGPIEAIFFDGDLPHFLSSELGIKYEQRNSLVVGIAMGFAVTPTIYSIAEDAIFSVPKHLTSGSLALGATPWQTLTRVVLLTASPGIFSAIMIGLGRAVGETMIVLMATGNTAVMDMSIFQGFRTLSANIGVEMPEAAVGTTHYRLLFMSALVLFVFTFFVNTLAEIVRQRLRERYSSL